MVASSIGALAGCAPTGDAHEGRAVVIVSGGAAVSPFTTNESACASGLAAGNTDTALRESLIAAGYRVFTAPAMDTWGVVAEPDPDSFGAFGGCPEVWPFDGLVPVYSALGLGLPDAVAPLKTCSTYPLTHSIFVSNALGLDWQTALTWNIEVLDEVAQTNAAARAGKVAAAGTGCESAS